MEFNMSILELIKKRRSVRTYIKKSIEQEKIDTIKNSMEVLKGENFRFDLVDFKIEEGAKLGTYGVIKGASTFIVGILNKEMLSDKSVTLDFGYAFEEIILKCTDLGLGTCWLAGTFNSKDVIKNIFLKDNEQLVMISPLGYADKIRGFEKAMRFMAKSDKRKPWEDIFYSQNFNTPLSRQEADEYGVVLDMVRLAPSAINKQPWRIVKTTNTFDFYSTNIPSTEKEEQKFNVTINDLGIALTHFEYSAKELGLNGSWINDNTKSEEKYTYIRSWKFDK